MNTYLYRVSNLKSTITFLSSVSWRESIFWRLRNRRFLQFIHNNNNNNNNNFFRWVFSECTEAVAASLVPLETIIPEICAFIPEKVRKLVTEKPFTSK